MLDVRSSLLAFVGKIIDSFPSSCSHEDEMSVCYIWWYNDTINETVQKLNVIRKENHI